MDEHSLLYGAILYLAAAVVTVPLFKRLGLGSVLGYLVAGVTIGPWGLGLISDVELILQVSEFGVVLLLFLIGLELNPRRLWEMRRPILGLGGAQVVATAIALTALGLLSGLDWRSALVAGMGLALSSTAIALQVLTERNLLPTPGGNAGFSVLLFQDIAVIPMLAVLPLLAPALAGSSLEGTGGGWLDVLARLGVIGAIAVGGHYLLRPILRVIAATGLREIFTAFALLLVIGTAALMETVHLSMALGAFLAGVLLADSEYRHALESDIEPFKGLLLGLFFIAVGMSIDFGLLLDSPFLVLALVVGLVAVKGLILYGLAAMYPLPGPQRGFFALVLSQGGEFAFVLFGAALGLQCLSAELCGLLIGVVALSMMTTPLLLGAYEVLVQPRLSGPAQPPPMETIESRDHTVIVAGFGRVGQVVARLLTANGIETTILDHDPEHIETIRRFGFKVFYGDAARLDLLRAAGADRARLLVLAIDDRAQALKIVDLVHEHFPNLRILARAWDVAHLLQLQAKRVTQVEREAFEGALRLGESALGRLGFGAWAAKQAANRF
ncbi:MAG TPA: glutathione-regulated potassium-efflux system protein KefC, partial [Chromatiaceae bacterium]|nr:glutathione-regulated potassium-efflux system protein KefC [Chromatiaceae bacterium]